MPLIFKILATGSSGNLYSVNGDMLIECGLSIGQIKRVVNHRLSCFRHCLISHAHKDHCAAMRALISAGMHCYSSAKTAEYNGVSGHFQKSLDMLKTYRIGDYQIMAFPVQHDIDGACGFLIQNGGEKLLFVTDTYYLRYKFSGLTEIAIECNWSNSTLSKDTDKSVLKRLQRTHFSLERVKEFLSANDLSLVKKISLIHISSNNGNADFFKKEVQRHTGKQVYVFNK